MDTSKRPPLWLSIGLACGCIIALAELPYGFYQLLRLAVTFFAAWLAWQAYENNHLVKLWLFSFLAALYNPFFKISLEKEVWEVVNVITALLIMFEAWNSRAMLIRKHDSD